MLDALMFTVAVLFFWSNHSSWSNFFWIVIALNLTAVITVSFLPESPRILLSLNREDEAIDSLNQIAWGNREELMLTSTHLENDLDESLLSDDLN